jgi:hypothetical protein
MKTIKFRQRILNADGTFKSFFYWGFIDDEFKGPAHQFGHPSTAKDSDRFTGLLDKNGKEIYEGDICIMKEIKLNGTNEFRGYVDFNLCSWVLNFISPRGYKLRRRLSEFHEAEIIGNRFENADLLK